MPTFACLRRRHSLFFLYIGAAAAIPICAFAQPVTAIQETHGGIKPGAVPPTSLPQASPKDIRRMPAFYGSPLRSTAKYSLGALKAQEMPQQTKAGLRAIGVRRPVPASALDTAETSVSSSGGRIWRLTLKSQDATGIRAHFSNFSVGNGEVW